MIQHMMLLFFARWRATDMLAAISDALNERSGGALRAQAAKDVGLPKSRASVMQDTSNFSAICCSAAIHALELVLDCRFSCVVTYELQKGSS